MRTVALPKPMPLFVSFGLSTRRASSRLDRCQLLIQASAQLPPVAWYANDVERLPVRLQKYRLAIGQTKAIGKCTPLRGPEVSDHKVQA